jgi:protein gp37
LDARHKWGGAVHWGAGVPRYRTSEHAWKQPLAWEKKAAAERWSSDPTVGFAGRPGFWPVFCASLADVFDNEVPWQWRRDLFDLIWATPNLEWLLVTKRVGNAKQMMPVGWPHPLPNVRLLITVCNQEEADRDIPKLLALPCKNGVSYEPALDAVNWRTLHIRSTIFLDGLTGMHSGMASEAPLPPAYSRGIEWLICGGESTQGKGKARPFMLGWGKDTIRQCREASVPIFFKQAGSNATNREGVPHPFKDRAGADPSEWPDELRAQEFPDA